jgi:hypothetical protein
MKRLWARGIEARIRREIAGVEEIVRVSQTSKSNHRFHNKFIYSILLRENSLLKKTPQRGQKILLTL